MKMFPIQMQFNRTKWENDGVAEDLPAMEIPWDMIAPHNQQSLKNHFQSVHRIAERGGFSRCEAISVIEDHEYRHMSEGDADEKLKAMVSEWLKLNS